MNKKTMKKLMTSPVISFIWAILFGAIIVELMGFSAIGAYSALLSGAFGSRYGIILTFSQSIPVMFTALAYTFAFKAGMKNLGAEGQFIAGACTAAIVGLYIPDSMPRLIAILVVMGSAALAGMLVGALTVLTKILFNANEMLISLMMNYVINYFTLFLINYPFKGEASAIPATDQINPIAKLPILIKNSQLNVGILIAIAFAIIMHFYLYSTVGGYETRCVGTNASVSRYKGMSVNWIMLRTFAISGMLAAVGGAVQVQGLIYNFMEGFSPGYGWDGMAAALLGGCEPITTVLGAVVFGTLRSGGMNMSIKSAVPADFIYIVEGVLVIFIATPFFLRNIIGKASKLGRKEK